MNGKIVVLFVVLVVVFSAVTFLTLGNDNATADGDITVVDDRGVSYTFNTSIDRIASLGKPFTQIFLEIGAGERIVAVDTYSLDFNNTHPELDALWVGGSIFGLNVEEVVSKSPDVVVTYNYLSQSVRDRIAALEALGIPVLAFNPQSYNDVVQLVVKLGTMSGENDRAMELSNQMIETRNQVALTVAGLGANEKPRVYFELWTYGESTVNIGSVSHVLIEMAGGINVATNAALPSTYDPNIDTVLSWHPDIIIVEEQHSLSNAEIVAQYGVEGQDPPAVYRFTKGYNTYDLNLMFGLMEMAEYLHPDLFDFS